MTTFNGKCHCGETEWKATLKDTAHILCHCGACQTLGGGAYSLNQVIPKADFKLTKGSLKKYSYKGDSGNMTDCFYCPHCTAHAYHHQHAMGEDTLVIRTILLDGGKAFKPAAELYGVNRLAWVPEVAQTFETTPPS